MTAPPEPVEIGPLTRADLEGVARLHCDAFAGRAALSIAHLGEGFLSEGFYRSGLDTPHFDCIVARHQGRVVGFVLSTNDHDALVRHMRWRHPIRLGVALVRAVLRRPSVLRAAWGNARFAGGWSPPARAGAAWGMVIATAEEARTRAFLRATRVHVGEALLSAMEDRMRSRGAVVWFGLTELGNDPMINLLRRRGARPGDPVHVQGEDMIPWEIDLDRGSDRGA